MELSKTNHERIEFKVISSDDKLILESIESYNKTYKTDFKVEEFIYDEVVFAVLSVQHYNMSDIFYLGYQFGGLAEFKRQAGEIDW